MDKTLYTNAFDLNQNRHNYTLEALGKKTTQRVSPTNIK